MPSSATRDDGLALAASGLELAASGLELAYGATGAERRKILDIPLLTLAAGARIGITGASGAGKSSLLHALTGKIGRAHV